MRHLSLISAGLLVLACVVVAQTTPTPKPLTTQPGDPPGMIVIRPKSTNPTPAITPVTPSTGSRVILGTDPNRPGYYVVRPQQPGESVASNSTTLPNTNGGVPHLEIVRPKGQAGQDPPHLPGSKIPLVPPPGTDPAPSAEEVKEGKILYESWDAAFCRGCKVGYFHVVIREYDRKDKKMIYGTKTMKLSVARFGEPVEMWAEDSSVETPEGEVVVTQMRQGIGKDQMLSLTGTVGEKKLSVVIEGQTKDKQEIPWPAGVLGVAKEATLMRDRKPKNGDIIEYLAYEGRLNRVIKYKATAGKEFEAEVVEGQKSQKLIPIVQQMEAIGDFKLPPATIWCSAETFEPLKMETDMPTFGGKLTVFRTTREAAMRAPTKLLDLAEVQSIKLDKAVEDIHNRAGVVYKVTLKGELPMEKAFASDLRQEAKNVDAKARTLELQVAPVRSPKKLDIPPVAPGVEFLADCFFIDWKNSAETKKHAKAAIEGLDAKATDWQKAQAVEKWVRRNMKSTEFSQAMATCANVAKSLSGDCTEYSVLAAGMCRALDIPSRTAIGVVYAVDSKSKKPMMAWHMWFEVYVEGQWLALDGTLGQGSIGPGHIKITDASWFEERSYAPLLPVLNVLGTSPKVEILKVIDRK